MDDKLRKCGVEGTVVERQVIRVRRQDRDARVPLARRLDERRRRIDSGNG